MRPLFDEPKDVSASAPPESAGGSVVGVAVNANVWDDYDYLFPSVLGAPAKAQRVRVPFGRGNRKTLGFVTDPNRSGAGRTLKDVDELLDPRPALDEELWELAEWIARYYLTPMGMVLSAMVPSAVGKRAPRTETVVFLESAPADWPKRLGSRQRNALDALWEARKQGVEPLTLEALLDHARAGRDTVQRLVKRGLVRTETRPVTLDTLRDPGRREDPFDLNDDQIRLWEALSPKIAAGGFSCMLLHGVTGSGKTEIYIRAIRQVVEAGRQAILLTPEIALATQTLQRLVERLPRVAVLHSGLTDAQRGFYWQQIRDGHAAAVVGPRSAVFAPTRKLGLLIVDEEHECGYKQDTAPRYHGRDVAIKRAAIANVPVLLGSATPSMESLHNARTGKYGLLRLPKRVRGLAMPTLRIVHLREDITRGRVELLGRTLTSKMAATLDRGEQIILLMNRRGYASYVFCPACQWILHCDDCLRPMVWHQAVRLCLCHHCDRKAELPSVCPACGGKVVLFGYGIQRIEDELARKFPLANVARMDSDTMTSPKQFQAVLRRFGDGEVDILLGTQMVAKGLDFPKVSLVGIASADTSLMINDFRASERTFQLIVQVAGRAGRGTTSGEVVVQTLHADDPAIRFAEHHDYTGFSEQELLDRREAHLPPYSRMLRFVVRHEKVDHAAQGAEELTRRLRALLPRENCTLIGPQQAEFARIRNRFRFHVLLTTSLPGRVQSILFPQMGAIARSLPAELIVDVDPIQLL